jgi:hypothetical protein
MECLRITTLGTLGADAKPEKAPGPPPLAPVTGPIVGTIPTVTAG